MVPTKTRFKKNSDSEWQRTKAHDLVWLNKDGLAYATEVVIKSHLHAIWRKYFVIDAKLKADHLGSGA